MRRQMVDPSALKPTVRVRHGAGSLRGHLSNWLYTLTTLPETGAFVGVIGIFAFFAFAASGRGFLTVAGTVNYVQVAAELGIIVVPVTLLMIAGEFDLSVGSMLGASAILFSYAVTRLGWPVLAAIILVAAVAIVVGVLNGMLVVMTGLPSFIVTLATLFILRGATIALTSSVTNNTMIQGVNDRAGSSGLHVLFNSFVGEFPVSVVWWIGLTLVGTWVLRKTSFGNWTFATGGDLHVARNVGVPVNRVRILLYICAALAAALVAIIQVLETNSADVGQGQTVEFQAVTAAVIGGTLLTGGYGSVIGAWFGSLAYGMVNQGIFFTNIDANWFQTFLGAMLLGAVALNHFVRRRAMRPR
jgi:simple sugar transport system permease protein